ncbi:MAG: phenylalanine--tRNA ligase subunit beta [Conexivisphaerales archaeon]
MPVISVMLDRLERLTGRPKEDVIEALPWIGVHIESIDKEYARLEYDPNRPDFSTDYGIARALKGRFEKELGIQRRNIDKSDWKIIVEQKVKPIRPFVIGLLAHDLLLDDETIRQLISMQEDLHQGIGRKRKKLAIGLHDIANIRPPVKYGTVGPDFKFTPLGYKHPMSIDEILKITEVGRLYGPLLSKKDVFPILMDSHNTVLSFPPIVNGTATQVTYRTKDLLVDVTGTDMQAMEDALAIVAEALWDAGGKIFSITVKDGEREMKTPNLATSTARISPEDVEKLIGLKLDSGTIVKSLRRARLDAKEDKEGIEVRIPRYRVDILHTVDVVEEVAYGYGFENLTPDFGFKYSKGSELEVNKKVEAIKRVAVGLGLQEVLTYSLSSKQTLYDRVLRDPVNAIKVESPKSSLYEYLKDCLSPDLLRILSENIHEQYPQKIFEISSVFSRDDYSEIGVKESLSLAVAISSDIATFTEIRSLLDTILLRTLGIRAEYYEGHVPFLADGRSAKCKVGSKEIGYVGEIKPRVLLNFGLRMPVAVFEIDLSSLI